MFHMLKSAGFLLFLLALTSHAQDLIQTGQQIGFNRHQQILSQHQLISQGEVYDRLQRVFARMTDAPDFKGGAAVPYRLFYLDSSEINAYASGGGMMYVTAGLMQVIRGNEGVLAFVMGHEMVHNRNQHLEKKYWRLVNMDYQYRQLYIKSGQLAASIFATAAQIAEAKIERDEEHEADQLGLRVAAEAGYHPDYAIFAARLLRAEAGEQSKFAAFFSNHPRWTTREERTERNYDEANAAFDRLWPSVADSPGGRPPAIAIVSPIKIEKKRSDVTVSTAIRVRNLRGTPAEVKLELIGEHEPEPVSIGSRSYLVDQTARDPVTVVLSQDAWKRRKGKQYIRVRVVSGQDELYCSNLIKAK
jgi:Zn-dependent protease with chaperone function